MKKVLIVLFTFISVVCYSQKFDGVTISGSQLSVINSFKEKGYTIKRYLDNCVLMNGRLAGENIELWIYNTPISKKVFKVIIYFDKEERWIDLKYSYVKYFQILSEKYGSPNDKYAFFHEPYYEGDGYEMTAVQLKKCTYSSFWFGVGNMNIGLSISEFKQIKIQYENADLTSINTKEYSILEQKSL